MSPEEIRALRGDLSREDFASALGVTPLTVYRWELPLDEKESRRPQRRIRQRLMEFRSAHTVGTSRIPIPPKTPPVSDPYSTFEFYDDIFNARWDAAQKHLQDRFFAPSSEPHAAIKAQIAQGMLQFLWRADAQGAWALIAPLLHQTDMPTWPASVAVPLHTLAALLHAAPDGRLFSPGRVNAHVAQAERLMDHAYSEFRALLRISEMWAAYHLGDAPLHDRLRRKSQEDFRSATSVVVKWTAWELGAIAAHLSGCIVEAIRFFRELVDACRQNNLPANEVRASAYLATMLLTAAEPLSAVRELLSLAEATALRQRVEPGWHTILLAGALAEVACRQCEFAEVEVYIQRGVTDAGRCQWAPIELAYTDFRVAYLHGRFDDMDAVEARYSGYVGEHRQPLARVIFAFADGLQAMSKRDMLGASNAFRRSAEAELEIGTLPLYETYGLSLAYYTAVLAGSEQARPLQRRAERALERMPLFWCEATFRLFRSAEAALEGRVADAIQHADAAEAALVRVGDYAQQLLAMRLRAIGASLLGEPDAQERLADTERRMKAVGLPIPSHYQNDAIAALKQRMETHDTTLTNQGDLAFIAQATNRLATRGISPAQVLEELCDIVAQWRNEDGIWLDEIPQKGRATSIRRTLLAEPDELLEFGDGTGRRYRIGVRTPLTPVDRHFFRLLLQITSMALEVVSLRGLTNPATTAVKELVPSLPGFIAASEASKTLLTEVSRVATSRASVLLLGESGVGKEMVAHAVYKLSTRSNRAFITFNCAAVPRELFEGQLFGYRKGAFTGATSNHPGVLRAADGGTLFLDEIGDLPLELQPKLLRFLENGEVFPLGETRPVKVDVRVIAATHRNLDEMVVERTFREDLYYRLAVVPITISPLRERREDILALAQHFLGNLMDTPPTLSMAAAQALMNHDWPGNVRELRNVIERTLAYVHGRDVIRREDLKF